MQLRIKISTIYRCSIERAFKTPLLCDVALVHTGYGIMPRITHCTDDAQWGAIGSSKKDVARIQGTPTKIEVLSDTYEIWSFQYATISFRNNKVVEWNDVLGRLLKVRYAY